MPRIECTHVEVYVFRRRGRRVEFLALRRSPGRRLLPGVWQPVTGKLEPRERPLDGAVREVAEETALRPRRWWTLESPTIYFDPESDRVGVLPLFAAEIGSREIVRLSAEHDAHRFVPLGEAGRLFLWDAQRAGLEGVKRQILGRGPLAAALEITGRIARSTDLRRRRRRVARTHR